MLLTFARGTQRPPGLCLHTRPLQRSSWWRGWSLLHRYCTAVLSLLDTMVVVVECVEGGGWEWRGVVVVWCDDRHYFQEVHVQYMRSPV